jgi:VCBS repeat-containing protein
MLKNVSAKGPHAMTARSIGKLLDSQLSLVVLEARIILDAAGATTAFALSSSDAETDAADVLTFNESLPDSDVNNIRDAISALAAKDVRAIDPTTSVSDSDHSSNDPALDSIKFGTLYALHGSSPDDAQRVVDAMADASLRIIDYFGEGDGLDLLYQSFPGETTTRTAEWDSGAEKLLRQFLDGDVQVRLEVRDSSDLLGAYAAFAATGPDGQPVVYLNASWLPHLSQDQMSALIIEETGHWIDHALNGVQDTPGDEGEAFATKVLEKSLTDNEWERIASESDIVHVEIDGVVVRLEFAALIFSNNAYFVRTSTDVATTQLETSEVFTTGVVGEAGSTYLFVSDPPEDPVFSGNNTRGTLSVVSTSNEVTASYFGEITRLFKDGSTVTGLQFFVYPDGYEPGSGDRQTVSETSILIDISAGFEIGRSYKTSSDPVSSALNALLPANTLTANDDTGAAIEAGGNLNATPGETASGNILNNDTDDDVLMVREASSLLTGNSLVFSDQVEPGNIIGRYGTLTLSSDGAYIYTVNDDDPRVQSLLGSASLSESFSYIAGDGKGESATATLTIKITAANDDPVANDDYNLAKESIAEDNQYSETDPLGRRAIGDVLGNDFDVDANDRISLVGSVTVSGSANATSEASADFTLTSSSNLNSVKGSSYPAFKVISGADVPMLNADGSQVTVFVGGSGSSLELVISYSGDLKIGDTLRIDTNGDGQANLLLGTVDTIVNKPSDIVNISQFSGNVAVGMVVTGLGVPEQTTVIAINHDITGKVTSVQLSSNAGLSNTAVTFSAQVSLGQTLTGQYGTLVLNPDGSYVYTPFANFAGLSEGQTGVDRFAYQHR